MPRHERLAVEHRPGPEGWTDQPAAGPDAHEDDHVGHRALRQPPRRWPGKRAGPLSVGQTDAREDERRDEGRQQRRWRREGREPDDRAVSDEPGDHERLGRAPNKAPEAGRSVRTAPAS